MILKYCIFGPVVCKCIRTEIYLKKKSFKVRYWRYTGCVSHYTLHLSVQEGFLGTQQTWTSEATQVSLSETCVVLLIGHIYKSVSDRQVNTFFADGTKKALYPLEVTLKYFLQT